MSSRRNRINIDELASAVAARLGGRFASARAASARTASARAASARAASARFASARAASARIASARIASARIASARIASARSSRVRGFTVASQISHERLASAIVRRLGATAASKAPVALMASGVSRRFASARVHGIVASHVARRIGSAVTKKLIASGKPNIVDTLASGIARHLSGEKAASSASLPIAEESAKSKT